MPVESEDLSYCRCILVFTVLADFFGIAIVLIGIFVPLEIKGQDYGDLLVYSGALLVLMSMCGWVMWYSGNIKGLSVKQDLEYKPSAMDRLARSLSRRIRRSAPIH